MRLFSRTFFLIMLTVLLVGCKHRCVCGCGCRCDCGSGVACCDSCLCGSPAEAVITQERVTYNIYVENSGSMAGFFSGTGSTLKTILKEYYDRLSSLCSDDDTVTLSYNDSQTITPYEGDILSFLSTAHGHCTASYSPIEENLALTLRQLDDQTVCLLVSDYSFTSSNQGIAMAQSGITKLFSNALKSYGDLSVAIYKYDCDFSGRYYPGGIPCNHRLPIYIWVLGRSALVKDICELDIKESRQELLLQPLQTLTPEYRLLPGQSVKMFPKDQAAVRVKEWKRDRQSGAYRLAFDVDISSVLVADSTLETIEEYSVTGGYAIDSVTVEGDTLHVVLSTAVPSPGVVSVSMSLDAVPAWVEEANYTGGGIPPSGQTQNIAYLINGVYDAYKPYKSCFNIDITLE